MEVMNTGLLKTDKLITKLTKLEDLGKVQDAIAARKVIGRWVI